MAVIMLLAVFSLVVAAPAQAFTGRGDDKVVIKEGEVIDDDLYVGANTLVVRGTIKGDLVAAGSLITIEPTGVIEGDLIAAGQGVVVRGKVEGDVRIAGFTLAVERGASVGEDLLAFGYSLDLQSETTVGQDVILGAGVASLSGDIARNVNASAAGLELNGKVGGDVAAEVGDENTTITPMNFQTQAGVPAPVAVQSGLALGDSAEIAGNLTYTARTEASLPGGVVGGRTTYRPMPVDETQPAPAQPTQADKAVSWLLDFLRDLAALLIVGFLLAYFFPTVLSDGARTLQAQPGPSFLWGIVVYVAFFFGLALLIFTVIMAAVVLGVITLGELVWTVLGIGALAFTAFTVSFHLAVSYISKILVGYLIGRWLMGQIKPDLVENRFWPAVIGVVLFALVVALPWVGWIINLFAVLFGLGALFLIVRARYQAGRDLSTVPA